MKRTILLLILNVIFAFTSFSQSADTLPKPATFTCNAKNGAYEFKPQLPALSLPVAGAPAPFYAYHWEFGDGSYSNEPNPVHAYTSSATYQPLLYATNNYDDTQKTPPPVRSRAILADGNPHTAAPADFKTVLKDDRQFIALKAIRSARKNEELVIILSYRNAGKKETDGELHLFFNEKVYPTKHFDFLEARTHFGESLLGTEVGALEEQPGNNAGWTGVFVPQNSVAVDNEWAEGAPIPNTYVDNARKAFRDEKTWTFPNMKPDEKRNMFISVKGTDYMLKDTSAIIHVKGIFVPGNPAVSSEEFTLEIEIVSSHDPNAIMVSDVRVNYRLIRIKDLDYKIKFQNNGEGPAKKVEVEIAIPEGLNKAKVKPVDWYPKCPVCPKEGTTKSCLDFVSTDHGITFTFRNIYLPGSHQNGMSDIDSTKGFVKYRIVPEKNMPKRTFRSQAKIVFDKNPPIYTNYSSTRFKKGFSPGPKAGYGYYPGSGEELDPAYGLGKLNDPGGGYAFIGCTFSSYKSWTVYPQAEILTGLKGRADLGEKVINSVDTTALTFINNIDGKIYYRRDSLTKGVQTASGGFVSVEIPVSIRKNINRWLGVGLGGSAIMIFDNGNTATSGEYSIREYNGFQPNGSSAIGWMPAGDPKSFPLEKTSAFSGVRTRIAFFGDVNIGSVRAGPHIGIRGGYVLEGQKPRPYMQVSVGVKL